MTGTKLITKERERQISEEGWTPEHDDQHTDHEMVRAAVCYAHPNPPLKSEGYFRNEGEFKIPEDWPWNEKWYKPTPDNRVRELVKAGALIAAEIDRLKRQEKS